MGYRKKFEDSYLDDEVEEFEGSDITDADRYIKILQKPELSSNDTDRLEALRERMLLQAKLPGIPGTVAKGGLITVARAYKGLGQLQNAVDLLVKVSDVATEIGDKDLYYQSMDEMSE